MFISQLHAFLEVCFHLVSFLSFSFSLGRLLITSLRQRGLQRTTGSLAGVRLVAPGPGHRHIRRLWSSPSAGLALLTRRCSVSALLRLQGVQERRRRREDGRRCDGAGNVTQLRVKKRTFCEGPLPHPITVCVYRVFNRKCLIL